MTVIAQSNDPSKNQPETGGFSCRRGGRRLLRPLRNLLDPAIPMEPHPTASAIRPLGVWYLTAASVFKGVRSGMRAIYSCRLLLGWHNYVQRSMPGFE